jgi:photosystem II stability/assembly factor-like uncharacterized protein
MIRYMSANQARPARWQPVAALLLVLLGLPAQGTAAPEYAPIMPLASQSLLLDITTAGERIITVGERGHILYSDDRGDQWTQARVPTTQMLTGVHFANAQQGWAVGHDGLILVSDDGGANWRIQRDGIAAQQQANLEIREQAYQQVKLLQETLASAGGDNTTAQQLALEDAAMDLEDAEAALGEPVFTSPLMDVWFSDDQHGWAVGAFGAFLGTDNGGQTWQDYSGHIDNTDEFHLNAITGDTRGRIFVAGEGGGMHRSLDGGERWESLPPFYEGSWFGVIYSAPHDALLLFGLRGNLYRSTDFGDSWNSVAGDHHTTISGGSASDSGRIALAGAVGTILQSADGGLTFTRDVLPDRLSLSSALYSGDRLILIGQGGVQVLRDE